MKQIQRFGKTVAYDEEGKAAESKDIWAFSIAKVGFEMCAKNGGEDFSQSKGISVQDC